MNITNQTINIHAAVAVNIGDHGTQQNIASIRVLLRQIESSNAPTEEKEEAKHRLLDFLAHPLVTTLLGNAGNLV